MLMTETALGRLVSPTEQDAVVEDAVLRVLFEFKLNPQNSVDGYLPEKLIADVIGQDRAWVARALELLKGRGLVEQTFAVRSFRLSANGLTYVYGMPGSRGLRGLM